MNDNKALRELSKKWLDKAREIRETARVNGWVPAAKEAVLQLEERAKELEAALASQPEQALQIEIAKARLDEATNWHQFGEGHDEDGWCCKRETELRDEVFALEMAAPAQAEEAGTLEAAVEWVLNDAAYKAPELIGPIAERWIERLRAAGQAAKGGREA